MRWLIFLCLSGSLIAEEAWNGMVFETGARKAVSEPQFFDLSGTALGQGSLDGSFKLEHPPKEVVVRAVGFSEKTMVPGPDTIYLDRLDFEQEEFTVTASRDKGLSRASISSKEIRKIAGAGGDSFRALQTLPGVVAVSDFSGQLAVRGGGPEDNKTYLDDIPWPVPFHFGGILATINSELLESVALHAGGFPARWGNADGGILEARTRPGSVSGFKGSADINLVTATFLLEGPMLVSDGVKSSWTLSGRRSYFDLVLPRLIDVGSTALPYFWDIGATFNLELGSENKFRLITLATDDALNIDISAADSPDPAFQGGFKYENQYFTSGLRWENSSLKDLLSKTSLYYYQVSFSNSFGKNYFIDLFPKVTGLRQDLDYHWGPSLISLGGGIEHDDYNVSGYTFRRVAGQNSGFITISDPAGITINAVSLEGFAYLQEKFSFSPFFNVTGGLRYDHGGGQVQAVTPRLGLEWRALDATTVSVAWGIYERNPSARELSRDFGNPDLRANLTEHLVAGVEQKLGSALLGRVEGYLKTFRDQVVTVPDVRLYSNEGEGKAAGVELFLHFDDRKRLFGWLSYSYSRSQRMEGPGQPWRDYQYDQPHVLTLVGNFRVTPRFEFGATWHYHSGPLITPIIGAVNAGTHYTPIYGDANSVRLMDYDRLDVRGEYRWDFSSWNLSFYLEVLNLLDAPNPLDRTYNSDFSSYVDAKQLPRLPYLGFTASY